VRLVLPSALALWAGATLLLSELRWFHRRPLVERLRPYLYGDARVGSRGVLSVASFRDVVGPPARQFGARLSTLLGVSEELGLRLERIHSPFDVTAFRVRELGWCVVGFGAGSVLALILPLPPALSLLFILGGPLFAFLVAEQHLANQSAQWQRRLFLELPVVSEQLGMLLSSGYSLGGALHRLAARGGGVCRADLARVCGRIGQGLGEVEALREWAAVAGVDALDRLVSVLALNRQAGDLGRLVSEEARSIRQEAHRQTTATIERRAQQVWIPVTVATLVPGVVFLAIPFIEAMRLFAGS
jgi:tight adherence protein C